MPPLLLVRIPGPPLLLLGVPVFAMIGVRELVARSPRLTGLARSPYVLWSGRAVLVAVALWFGTDLVRKTIVIV